jgi:hypothetical protein
MNCYLRSFTALLLLLCGSAPLGWAFDVATRIPPGVSQVELRQELQPETKEAFAPGFGNSSLKRLILGSTELAEAFQGEVRRSNSLTIVRLNYGWSPAWTLGVTLPWEQRQQNSSLSLKNPNGATAEQQAIARNVGDENVSGLGDVTLHFRYEMWSSYSWLITLEPRLRLGTGSVGTAQGPYPIAIGDGQNDVGAVAHLQWYPQSALSAMQHVRVEGMNQFQGERETLTGEKRFYAPGNIFDLRYGWTLGLESWLLGAEFQYFWQGATSLDGQQNDTRRLYQWAVEAGWGNLSELNRGPVAYPWQAKLGTKQPIFGENLPKRAVWYLSGELFF